MIDDPIDIGETCAALSANVHTDSRYGDFYLAVGPSLSGIPGIWRLCAEVALAFNRVEMSMNEQPGIDYEWMDAVDSLSERIVTIGLRTQLRNPVDWAKESKEAIRENIVSD